MLFQEQNRSRCAFSHGILAILTLATSVGLAQASEPRAEIRLPPPGIVHLADLTYCAKTGFQLDLAYP